MSQTHLPASVSPSASVANEDLSLLEWVLSAALSESSARTGASDLLQRFHTLNDCLSAPDHLLKHAGLSPNGIDALRRSQRFVERVLLGRFHERDALTSRCAVHDYLRSTMAGQALEVLRVLYLDGGNRLIRDEVLRVGGPFRVAISTREIAHRALDLSASAVILAHNHPSGNAAPSSADVTMTGELRHALGLLEIALHDHFIVARNNTSSFVELGLLPPK